MFPGRRWTQGSWAWAVWPVVNTEAMLRWMTTGAARVYSERQVTGSCFWCNSVTATLKQMLFKNCHQVYLLSTFNCEDRNADQRERESLREGEGLQVLILLRNKTPQEGRGQDVWASCSQAQTKGRRVTFQAGLSRGFSVCSPVQIKSIISWLGECEKMTRAEKCALFLVELAATARFQCQRVKS